MKPLVMYSPIPNYPIKTGLCALITAHNHPLFPPNYQVFTSTVIDMDEQTGIFETKNTLYKLKGNNNENNTQN